MCSQDLAMILLKALSLEYKVLCAAIGINSLSESKAMGKKSPWLLAANSTHRRPKCLVWIIKLLTPVQTMTLVYSGIILTASWLYIAILGFK